MFVDVCAHLDMSKQEIKKEAKNNCQTRKKSTFLPKERLRIDFQSLFFSK